MDSMHGGGHQRGIQGDQRRSQSGGSTFRPPALPWPLAQGGNSDYSSWEDALKVTLALLTLSSVSPPTTRILVSLSSLTH